MKATIEKLLEDYRKGKMIILMDDEGRENEGDLLIAAEKVTKEDINFMATHGRGLICLTLTQERCQQLNLPLMVSQNRDLHSTNFTVSIEAASGVTTGISAADRAKTIIDAVAKDAKPIDIIQPGHVFPIISNFTAKPRPASKGESSSVMSCPQCRYAFSRRRELRACIPASFKP